MTSNGESHQDTLVVYIEYINLAQASRPRLELALTSEGFEMISGESKSLLGVYEYLLLSPHSS